MKDVDFTTLSCTNTNMPNVNTMGNRTQAKNLPFNSSVCSFVYPASNVPSMETSMCVSQPQPGYNIFESIHIWLQKTCTVLCIIFTFLTSLIIFDVEYYTNGAKRRY